VRVYLQGTALFHRRKLPGLFSTRGRNIKHLGHQDHDLERVGGILQDGDLNRAQEIRIKFRRIETPPRIEESHGGFK
jgi:hypothetical protein